MNRRDRISAVGCLLAGGLLTVESLRLDMGNLARPGPGFVPLALGIGLLALSGVYLVMALAHRARPAPDGGARAGGAPFWRLRPWSPTGLCWCTRASP